MNRVSLQAECGVAKYFPPACVLKGIVPHQSEKEWELYEKWKRLCGKTRLGTGCEKCSFFVAIWE